MEQIHSLLKRQLKRCFGDGVSIPKEWQGFLDVVNAAYYECDVDRAMLERSLELSSQELVEANSQMQAIFQAIPDLLFRLDREGTILDYKAGATADFFLQPKDLFGKRIQDIPITAIGDQFREAIRQVQEKQTVVSIEYALTLHRQASYYEARFVPLRDDQIVVIIRNITERKVMEQALRQAQNELEERIAQRTKELQRANEQLAALYTVGQTITAPLQLNVVLDVIARSTAELLETDTGVILLLDDVTQTLTICGAYGLSEEVVKGTRDRVGESIAGRVVQTGQPIIANDLTHDPRFFNPAAVNEGLLACASVPLIAGGKIIGTLDVHSKSRCNAFHAEHIRTLSMLAGQAAIAIENARLYEQLQAAHAELELRVQERTAELVTLNVQLHEEIVERQRVEDALLRLNEELEQRVEARTAELKQSNIALQESLDTLQRTQTQLIQAEKMAALGGLVAGIAHEINTPVGVGVTAASHLEDQTRELAQRYHGHKVKRSDLESYLETTQEAARILLTNLQRAADLVRSFKQVAVDQTTEEKRRFNLKDYIDDVLRSLHPKLKKTPHTVRVICPENLKIESYPGAFSQILTNFIMNSLIHGFPSHHPGKIELHVQQAQNILQIRYSDNGRGMTPQEYAHIFEPFYTTKRGQGGTGLGLHIVYNLVTQRLNGSIVCESAPGAGTTFVIRMPIDDDIPYSTNT